MKLFNKQRNGTKNNIMIVYGCCCDTVHHYLTGPPLKKKFESLQRKKNI